MKIFLISYLIIFAFVFIMGRIKMRKGKDFKLESFILGCLAILGIILLAFFSEIAAKMMYERVFE